MKQFLTICIILTALLVSCATTEVPVETALPDNPYDVGIYLAGRCASSSAVVSFISENSRSPKIAVGNTTCQDNINDSQLIRGFQTELIQNQNVEVIARSSEREEIRNEREDQLSWSDIDQAKSLANEDASDLLVKFYVDKGRYGYTVSLDLLDIESGRIVWTDGLNNEIKFNLDTTVPNASAVSASSQSASQPSSPTLIGKKSSTIKAKTSVVSYNVAESETKVRPSKTGDLILTIAVENSSNISSAEYRFSMAPVSSITTESFALTKKGADSRRGNVREMVFCNIGQYSVTVTFYDAKGRETGNSFTKNFSISENMQTTLAMFFSEHDIYADGGDNIISLD